MMIHLLAPLCQLFPPTFVHLIICKKGTYVYAVERGEEKIRRSVINLEMDHKGADELALRIGGEAVMTVEGVMDIPES